MNNEINSSITSEITTGKKQGITSGLKMVARIATQFVASYVVTGGIFSVLKQFTPALYDIVGKQLYIDITTILILIITIALAQFGYSVNNEKLKWFF